jgi:hypothetical protein
LEKEEIIEHLAYIGRTCPEFSSLRQTTKVGGFLRVTSGCATQAPKLSIE